MWKNSVALIRANEVYRNRKIRKRFLWARRNWRELMVVMVIGALICYLAIYFIVIFKN